MTPFEISFNDFSQNNEINRFNIFSTTVGFGNSVSVIANVPSDKLPNAETLTF